MITNRDVREQVVQALGDQAPMFDVEAIVADLLYRNGLAGEYDDEEFWSVVAVHERPPTPDPREAFETDLTAEIRAHPTPVRWADERTVVTMTGLGWARTTWPQLWGTTVTIATPDGAEHTVDGESIGSWDELWALVREAGEEWADDGDRLLAQAHGAQDVLDRAARAVQSARARRDVLIREASAAGVSAYRIAKRLGISQPTVGRVLP